MALAQAFLHYFTLPLSVSVSVSHSSTNAPHSVVYHRRFMFSPASPNKTRYHTVNSSEQRDNGVTHSVGFSTGQSPSSETISSSASQKIPYISWNWKFYHLFHQILPFVPILSHVNVTHALPHDIHKINSNILPSKTRSFKCLYSSGFLTKICLQIFVSPRLNLLDFKTPVMRVNKCISFRTDTRTISAEKHKPT